MRLDLKHTPITLLSKDGEDVPDYNKTYVVARTDTKEFLCIGSFGGGSVADLYDHGEKIYLRITPDGKASEHYPAKNMDQLDICKFTEDNSAIVMVDCGSYWLVPYGFDQWAKSVFTNQLTITQ